MPNVSDLSTAYESVMIGPRRGTDVCSFCFNLTDGFGRCYACTQSGNWLAAMAPISYSVGGEQLHHALAGYKRLTGSPARQLSLGLASVLWRYLPLHEGCLTRAAGVAGFQLVTVVPSSRIRAAAGLDEAAPGPADSGADPPHALHALVSEHVAPVRGRYEPLLRRSREPLSPHRFSHEKYEAIRRLNGEGVLLIDDTWTTGANAQSAAAALREAGAAAVAAIVIGRHVNRDWHHNDRLLRRITPPFDWAGCALCGPRIEEAPPTTSPQGLSAVGRNA